MNRRAVAAELRANLALPVVAVGLLGGIVGAAYVAALEVLLAHVGPEAHGPWLQVVVLAAAGAGAALAGRLLGDSGDVELLVDNIHVLGGADDVRRLRSLVPASLLCIGTGGPLGPEAPLVQTCGTVGTVVADRSRRRPDERRILTITGMAAGFAVLFGTPLGAALFALEILHRRGLEYHEALVPALLGALAGFAANLALAGTGLVPVWRLPDLAPVTAGDLGWAAACGLAGALGARGFMALVGVARRCSAAVAGRLTDRLPALLGVLALPAAGGVALGLLGVWSPFALTNGEGQVEAVVFGGLAASALAVAAAAKLAAVVVALASRWKGGFIIPLFFLGFVLGQLLHLAVPATNVTVVMAALAVALCVGVTRTPLGATLAVTGMVGLPLLPTSLVAAVLALLCSGEAGLIETQRSRAAEALSP